MQGRFIFLYTTVFMNILASLFYTNSFINLKWIDIRLKLFGYKGVVQIENVVTNLKIIMKLKLAS